MVHECVCVYRDHLRPDPKRAGNAGSDTGERGERGERKKASWREVWRWRRGGRSPYELRRLENVFAVGDDRGSRVAISDLIKR